MTPMKIIAIAACLAWAAPAFAQEPAGPQAGAEAVIAEGESVLSPLTEEEFAQYKAEFEASLQHRTGEIKLASGHVTLNVPDGYYFLDTTDARKVL